MAPMLMFAIPDGYFVVADLMSIANLGHTATHRCIIYRIKDSNGIDLQAHFKCIHEHMTEYITFQLFSISLVCWLTIVCTFDSYLNREKWHCATSSVRCASKWNLFSALCVCVCVAEILYRTNIPIPSPYCPHNFAQYTLVLYGNEMGSPYCITHASLHCNPFHFQKAFNSCVAITLCLFRILHSVMCF